MRPLVRWSALFAAGVALQGRLEWAASAWYALAAVLGPVVAIGTARGRRLVPLAMLLVLVCGAAWLSQYESRLEDGLAPFIDAGPVLLTGQVVNFPERDGDRTHVVIKLERVESRGRVAASAALVRVTLPASVGVQYGDTLQIRAILERPAAARNPGAFDYREHLRRQGITTVATVHFPRHAVVVERGVANPLLRAAAAVREWVAGGLAAVLQPSQAALMTGLVLGERRQLTPEVEAAFLRAGAMHLLAVSGLHVGFVAAVAWRLLRALRLPRAAAAVAAGIVVWVYVLAAGARPPAVRAAVATSLGLLAAVLGRERDMVTALAAAALALLLYNPLLLFDVSFQLSFAAVAGILALYGPVRRALQRLPGAVAAPVAVTAGAQWGVTPLLAYHFQQISLVGFAGSLIGGPLTGVLVPLGLATGLLYHLWPQAAQALGAVSGWLADGLVASMAALARWAGATVNVPQPSVGSMLVWWGVGAVLVARGVLTPSQRRAILWACAVIVIAGIWTPLLGRGQGVEMLVLDVGQGDAILIRAPSGAVALVDGGGRVVVDGEEVFNAGRDVILPLLGREGVRGLDAVILTHAHDDHLAGLLPVLETLDVGVVVDGGHPGGTPLWEAYMAVVAARGLRRQVVHAGYEIALDGRTILEVLYPPQAAAAPASETINDHSLVLRLRFGDTAVLLTGDLEAAGQRDLLGRGTDLRADVVKVPHHGSRLSLVSNLYAAAGAAAAIIPVGRNNYGHPHPDVLAALERHSLVVYRTDLHGAVRWWSDGRRWRVCPAVAKPDAPPCFECRKPGAACGIAGGG